MIVKAETPQPIIPKSLASASSVAWLLHQKFEMSLPFHRQEQEWKRYGIALNRTTMANWVMNASNRWLTPLYKQLHAGLLKGKIAFADETTMQVLNEPGRKATSKSYMWLYRNGTETNALSCMITNLLEQEKIQRNSSMALRDTFIAMDMRATTKLQESHV